MSPVHADGPAVTSRIVLYGPPGAGTTGVLETIARRVRADQRGTLVRKTAGADGTARYEMLPVELGEVRGLRPRFHLTTVPGGAEYAPIRRQILKGVDGILFVLGSAPEQADVAAATMQELIAHLAAYGRPLENVPMVILLNRRDRADTVPAEQLLRPLVQRLSGRRVPVFEAVSADGRGVLNALSAIAKLALARAERSARPAPPEGRVTAAAEERAAAPPAEASVLRGALAEGGAGAGGGRDPGAADGVQVRLGTPRATADGLVVPLFLRDGRGPERRLSLAFRIELSSADGSSAGGAATGTGEERSGGGKP